MSDRPVKRLADGSVWNDPPTYFDGSGCSKLGNRRHNDCKPPSRELLMKYGCEELLELYGYVN